MTTPKVALITGANKGIGFETARGLGKLGMIVLLGSRERAKGEEAAAKLRAEKLDVRFLEIDVTNEKSVSTAEKWVENEIGRLEILVNNAGINLQVGPPSAMSIDEARRTFEVNVLGVMAVTRAMLPLLLRAGKAGRIVNVSSGLGSLSLSAEGKLHAGSPYLSYSASKSALNMITVQYAHELREAGIKVNAAAPGFTATDLNQHSGHQTPAEGAEPSIHLATLGDDGPTGQLIGRKGRVEW